MGAQNADIIVAHLLEVGHGDMNVDLGLQPQRRPEALHIGIIREAGTVDGVVKSVVNHCRAELFHRLIFGAAEQGRPARLHFSPQIRREPEREGMIGRRGFCLGVFLVQRLVLGFREQDAAQHAAGVPEADHPVFFVGINGAFFHKALSRQRVQLGQRRVFPGVGVHFLILFTLGQRSNSGICLLHPGCIRPGERLLCRCRVHGLLRKCSRREHRADQYHQCAERAQHAMMFLLHLLCILQESAAGRRYSLSRPENGITIRFRQCLPPF